MNDKKTADSFDNILKELKDYIEELEETKDVLLEICRVQHELIAKLVPEDEKAEYKAMGILLR